MTTHYPPSQAPYVPPPQPPRKHRNIRRWLFIASAVFAAGLAVMAIAFLATLGVLSGGEKHVTGKPPAASPIPVDTSPVASPFSQPPAQPVFTLGESAAVAQNGQDAATITVASARATTSPVDQYSDPPAHGWFVIVRVTARAQPGITDGFDLSSSDFYARVGHAHYDEGNGNAYEYSGRELMDITLNAGENTSGYLVFDLPSPHGRIVYAPNYTGPPLGSWKF